MKIFNVRKGFATNSSSSHSVVEIEQKNGKYNVITDEYSDFGWNFFTVAEKEAKEIYFASVVRQNLKQFKLSDSKINKYIDELFGKGVAEKSRDASIDHQSVITLPRNWNSTELHKEFIKEMIDYIRQEKVVILGGNDNDDKEHELKDSSKVSPFDKIRVESSNDHYVARKDKNYWTIFSRENGEKVRFSFEDIEVPKKATAPELADIKITDFCPYACDFCYQDSTMEGKHASMKYLEKIADELEKAQVYEVALGGGETTLHPNFVEILKLFKSKNIVPNFTTKNFNLLRQSNAKEIVENCGAMAFSVQSVEDMMKVKSSLIEFEGKESIATSGYFYGNNDKKSSPWNPKITFQLVMGVMPMDEFKKMLDISKNFGVRLTLLGYKENGRGASFAPHDYNNWLDITMDMKKKHNIPVSIDTALASEFEKELLVKGIDEKTFHMNEGAFSVYIDATKMNYAPSSYVGLEQAQDFNENWLEGYADMNVRPTTVKTIRIKYS